MYKICAFSDSHEYMDHMEQAITREKPDMCLFMGDGLQEFGMLSDKYPDIKFIGVQGNCDMHSTEQLSRVVEAEGVRIFMAHGHHYGVKMHFFQYDLIDAALEKNCSIALFGHTHIPYKDEALGVSVMNPGTACGYGKGYYGTIEIQGPESYQLNLKTLKS